MVSEHPCRIPAAVLGGVIYLTIYDMFDTFTEPDWDSLYVEFDPYGDACAMQCRHAQRSEDADDAWEADLAWGFESELRAHGLLHPDTLRAWSELCAYRRTRLSYWDYRDSVFLGPYTREALVGRDDYREF